METDMTRALVTIIPVDGVATRVKLVFAHRQFKRKPLAERYAQRRNGRQANLPREIVAEFGKRPRAVDFDLHVDRPEEWDKIEAEGEEVLFIACPGGTIAIMPKAVTFAKVVAWPLLAEQGDGGGNRAPEQILAEGFSVTAWMDNFSKELGRRKALEHLIATTTLTGPAKGKIVECYARRLEFTPVNRSTLQREAAMLEIKAFGTFSRTRA